ncbi:MAG TPA: hydantoinase/oxoprolinase family protein [Bradyrhizobium sp.]|uniref:hydantoinase/oxoprolinase family protein n=1 Tax=Bradyrhizobium sp. TaxID=376 RepID=UPI002D8082E9|nr:hydantoinase/oxoprolinase family protein [Bradyrhizobium sp.]HET7885861.1 hydantoinase/oxoprolinase family protein [Bradyrhizobium sp.]
MSKKSYRIGIDVGGTFTKAALLDNIDGSVVGRSSVHTTHDHPDGVAAGVIEVFERVLSDAGIDARDVVLLAHSTTQATNALLEGDVARVGILGLAGARAAKLAEAQVRIDPIELAPGRVLETCNRFLLSDGLDRKAVENAVAALRAEGAQVLVASAAFGVDNTSAEELVRDVGGGFGLPTTCGHEVTRLYGLTTRTRTAVINASILPRMIATANLTETSIKKAGIDAPLMIMRGDGGVMDISEMRHRPAMTMLSGPAASVAGSLMHVGMSDGIYFEVGGTSTNLGVVKAGRPVVTYANVGGHDTYVSSLDVRVLGVAGGSLIRIAEGAVREVGPRSAHIAGLRYACFAPAEIFANARVVLFEPKPGDGGDFVAIETEHHGRFALTNTCAANAAALTRPDMHCYAPPEAARAAFAPLAAMLGKDVVALAMEVLASAAGKVTPTIRSLIREYQLDEDQQVLIGTGGGIGALLPTVAEQLGLRFEIAKDAEIISSIGAALAMVREVVERVNPDPSSDDIAHLREETLQAIAKLGADPKTVDVSVEIDRQTGRIRAIATGAAALRSSGDTETVSERQACRIAARSLRLSEDDIELAAETPGAFVYTPKTGAAHSLRIVDRRGNVRLQRSHAVVQRTTVANWRNSLQSMHLFGPQDPPDAFFGAVLLYDSHLLDVTDESLYSNAVKIVDSELAGVPPQTPVVLIGLGRATLVEEMREENGDGEV